MPQTVRDEQIVVRVAAALRGELERAAAEQSRKLGDQIRAVLIDYATERTLERERAAA